jgi:hypothetical protein
MTFTEKQLDEAPPAGRVGDWIRTFTGRQFWPLDARVDEIDIRDIAHALSMLCRYGGHCVRFYSVAEHCVLMARALPAQFRYAALMHDAAEGYLIDLPRPIKRCMPEYAKYEAPLLANIFERYRVPEMPSAVLAADSRILVDEQNQNMNGWVTGTDGLMPLGVTLQYWTPEVAEQKFLDAFLAYR